MPQYRLLIILDRQCNSQSASVLDIFTTADINSFNNLSNSKRFKILKEWTGTVTPTLTWNDTAGTYATSAGTVNPECYLKCSIPISYTDQAGGSRVIGEITSNNILVVGFSLSSNCDISFVTRVRFTDN